MEFNNRFAILSLPENDEPEEQNLSDHVNGSTWLSDLANRKRYEAKPISSSLELCNICCKIFSDCELSVDSNKSYPHHPSHKSLMRAVQQSCYICSLLLENSTALFGQFYWPAILGSRKLRWLSYNVKRLIGGDFGISFRLNNPKDSEIEVLQLRVFSFWVYGHLAIQPLGHSTWSTESKNLVSQWLRTCIAKDSSLGSSLNKFLPTRLLHVELMEDGEYRVELCQGATLSRDAQYLTLSHRWGGKQMFCLLKGNEKDLSRDVGFKSLPETFQHAIIATSDLGYKYLWIDSLCIIQDSQEDWLKEGVQMGKIYKSAVCNIAASAFEYGHAGLFRSRNIETLLPLKVDIRWSTWDSAWGNPEGYIMLNEDWETSVDSAPLGERGWVFQERILSPRIIHFGARQLFWADQTNGGGTEQWPKGIPFEADGLCNIEDTLLEWWQLMLAPKDTYWKKFDAWGSIVEEYSKREFTYDTDKLAGISGIAREAQEVTGDEYLAGLWKVDLLDQLLWAVCDPDSSSRIQPYTAPTWSWASMNGNIRHVFRKLWYDTRERSDFHSFHTTKLQEAETSPILDHGTGPVKAGFLRLKGPLRQAYLIRGNLKSKQRLSWAVGHKRRKIYFLPDSLPISESDKPVGFDQVEEKVGKMFDGWFSKPEHREFKAHSYMRVHLPSQSVFLLPIYCASCSGTFITIGLALIPTDSARGQFRREGIFFTPNHNVGESILGLPCEIDCLYYETKKKEDNYTVSII